MLSNLNSEQLSSVKHFTGSMLVLAGAGSGKTKVLTTRIAWLIREHNVNLPEILAVTFTNKAAKEMLNRVSSLLEQDTRSMWIGTFHSIALRLLSKHHVEAGLPAYFHVIDAQDQLNLLRRIIKEANLEEERYSPRELQKFINSQKEQCVRADTLIPDGLRQELWVKLYLDYEKVCNRDGLVDFTELLLRSYEMFLKHKDLLNFYQQQFKHILVDEFQDTNHLQYLWLKTLCGKSSQIFAVGDDDQSIYSFRGAKVANMQAFLKDFNIAKPIRLEQNYRSTPHILNAANAVIGNNKNRIGKTLWTNKDLGEKIKLYEGYTEEDEAYFVADEIKSLEAKGVNLNDIAILYRSNAQSRVFEQFFYNRRIAYRVYGGLRFFDRQEIKHLLSYLRLVVNHNDNEAFLRVVNFPVRGVGAKTLENLQSIAHANNISLFQACEFLEGKAKAVLNKFTQLINLMKKESKELTLPEVINYLIDASGLREHYSTDKKNGIERLENLNELVSAVTNFRFEEGSDPVVSFLMHAVLESGENQAQNYDQAVQLMTVHAAKGLEFKVVFIVGLEDGLFPHENCLASNSDLEEERRLMYVAVTRAREVLYLLRACSRLLWGKRQSGPISRFVDEIPGDLISNLSGISKIGNSSLLDYAKESGNEIVDFIEENISNPENRTSRVNISNQNLTLKIGDMVKHEKFGMGRIARFNVEGKKLIAEIIFIIAGKKTLDLNIARIKKV